MLYIFEKTLIRRAMPRQGAEQPRDAGPSGVHIANVLNLIGISTSTRSHSRRSGTIGDSITLPVQQATVFFAEVFEQSDWSLPASTAHPLPLIGATGGKRQNQHFVRAFEVLLSLRHRYSATQSNALVACAKIRIALKPARSNSRCPSISASELR